MNSFSLSKAKKAWAALALAVVSTLLARYGLTDAPPPEALDELLRVALEHTAAGVFAFAATWLPRNGSGDTPSVKASSLATLVALGLTALLLAGCGTQPQRIFESATGNVTSCPGISYFNNETSYDENVYESKTGELVVYKTGYDNEQTACGGKEGERIALVMSAPDGSAVEFTEQEVRAFQGQAIDASLQASLAEYQTQFGSEFVGALRDVLSRVILRGAVSDAAGAGAEVAPGLLAPGVPAPPAQ